MALAGWDATIPSKARLGTWTRTPDKILDTFKPAVGEPIVGKQASAAGYTHVYTVRMTDVQLAQMETQWEALFDYGVTEVAIPHPHKNAVTFGGRLVSWTVTQSTKNAHDVQFTVYELPA